MNFNIYISKNTGTRIARMAKALHRSRNSIINEALEEWLSQQTSSKWPEGFFDFEPIEDVPEFKDLRSDLKILKHEDPLA